MPLGAQITVHHSVGIRAQAGAVSISGEAGAVDIGELIFHGLVLDSTAADIDLGTTDIGVAVDLGDLDADGADIVLDLIQGQITAAGTVQQCPVGRTHHFAPVQRCALGVFLGGNIHIDRQNLGVGVVVGVETQLVHSHSLVKNDVDVVVSGQIAVGSFNQRILGLLVARIVGVPLGIQIVIDHVGRAGTQTGAVGVGGEAGAVNVGKLLCIRCQRGHRHTAEDHNTGQQGRYESFTFHT